LPSSPLIPGKTIINENRKQDLINYYDQTTSLKVRETEARLSQMWKPRINELLLILRERQETSLSFGKRPDHDYLRVEILADYEINQLQLLEKRYQEEFSIKKELFQEKCRENLSKLISQIQEDHFSRLESMKQDFIFQQLEKNQEDFEFSQAFEVKKHEKNIRAQAVEEVAETLESLKKELEIALEARFKEVDEKGHTFDLHQFDKDLPTWRQEVQTEELFQKKQENILQLRSSFMEKIKKELVEKVATETLLRRSQIYENLNSTFLSDFQHFSKALSLETQEKIAQSEKVFQENFFKIISQNVEKELRPIEIKIKINYHKKLDFLRDSIRSDMESRFQVQFKVRIKQNFKRTVELEKISLGQYKANCNVFSRTLEQELKSQNKLKSKEKSLLLKKSEPNLQRTGKICKNLGISKTTENGLVRPASQSSFFKSRSDLRSSARTEKDDEQIIYITERPPASSLSFSRTIPTNPDHSSPCSKKLRIISPSMTEEMLNTLLSSKLSSSRSSSHSRCQSVSQLETQKKYSDLLEKHHGPIIGRK
jgi:hypothetical protein